MNHDKMTTFWFWAGLFFGLIILFPVKITDISKRETKGISNSRLLMLLIRPECVINVKHRFE